MRKELQVGEFTKDGKELQESDFTKGWELQ